MKIYCQKSVILVDSVSDYSIDTCSYILFDSNKKLTVQDVAFGKEANSFKLIRKVKDNLGYRKEAVWIRFSVNNKSTKEMKWLVSLNYAVIDKVFLYTVSRDSVLSEQKAGMLYPMSMRKIKSRFIVFPLFIKPGKETTYFIRIESGAAIPIGLEIYSPETFYGKEQASFLLLGIFYGSLTIMAFYNLFLFFSAKDASYLLYSLYVFFVGYYQAYIDGLVFQYLTPNLPQYSLALTIFSASSISLGGSLFVRKFLSVKKYSTLLDGLFKLLITLILVYIAYVVLFRTNSAELTGPFGLAYIILAIVSGMFCMRRGNINAKYYLIATSLFVIGSFFRAFRLFGFVNESFLTEYGMQIGILAEMTILSFALGNRINEIKRNHEIDKALIRSRIADDLHEEIGSNLSSISLSSRMVANNSPLEPNEKKQLEDIGITARETADSIKDIIWFINPEHDKIEDFVLKMKDTATKLFHGINCTFLVDDIRIIKSKGLLFSRNLFLIYKELLNNIVKHSKAKNVKIAFKDKGNTLEFKVEDDGIGFEEDKIKYGEGIRNIKNRARSIGANAFFNSGPGKGTEVTILINN